MGALSNIFSKQLPPLELFFDLSFCYEERTGHNEKQYEELFSTIGTEISQFQPDLIFVNKCLSPSKWQEILKIGVPVVHMVHDHEGYCLRGSKTFPLSQKACPYKAGLCCFFPGLAFLKSDEKGQLRLNWPKPCEKKQLIHLDQKSDLFLVASNYMKKTLEIQGFESEKIKVLFGVPEAKVGRSHFSDKNILVYIGQIIRGKGLYPLIESLAQVPVPFRLDVFGTGSDEERCRRLANELGLHESIHFHGFTSREVMQGVLQEATLGVVPSVWAEPFGKVGVEIMQQGLPVVAFDNGGISDWLQDGINGYLVQPIDTLGFAQKITKLLTDKTLAKELGQQAKVTSEQLYDFDRYIQELVGIFNELIGKK